MLAVSRRVRWVECASMNLEQLKKNVGWRVQLEPLAIHLDALGRELPGRNLDWIIGSVTGKELRRDEATSLGLTFKLGKDNVHSFTDNRTRSVEGGLQYCFLTLDLQLYIQGDKIKTRPCRPGERVPPLPPAIADKEVDLDYPAASGLQRQLHNVGYRLSWCNEARLNTLVDLEGSGGRLRSRSERRV
jgi:hypothetical protein